MRTLLFLTAFTMPAFGQWTLDTEFKSAKPEDLKNIESTPAPKGATILFDGTSLDGWLRRDDLSKTKWKIADGAMEGVKGAGDVVTKEKFGGKFKLHVEFRVPYEPKNTGQGRGNSGVYVQGRYEVQILDSYGLKSTNTDCGAIYEVAAPSVNACKAPTIWQSFDIEFTAPVFESGRKREPARMTVHHNGVKIHDAMKIDRDNTRAGAGGKPEEPGPILFQDHGHAVQFRNIWLIAEK